MTQDQREAQMGNGYQGEEHPGIALYKEPKQVKLSDHASMDDLRGQISVIQDAMKSVMRDNEHFGVIPGTNKPTLLKPGAEKLSLLFRLAPKYEVTRHDMKDHHREYEVKCTLIHINTGNFIGQGVGSCSTMEKKYRYRNIDEPTGVSVPKSYWDNRDSDVLLDAISDSGKNIPKNSSLGTTKENGSWEISFKRSGENPDIADTYNTVLKMAKKRAHVDAILTATAASDIFTQDVEDMPEFESKEVRQSTTNGTPPKNRKKSPQNDDNKDWLNEGTKEWDNAENAVRAGKAEPEDLRDYYKVSKSNMDHFERLKQDRLAEMDSEFNADQAPF